MRLLSQVTQLSMAVLLSTGCVSMVAVTPLPKENQNLRYYSGAGLVSSSGEHCSVVFGPLDEVQNQQSDTMFLLSVTNLTLEAILIKPKDLVASTPGAWGKEDSLYVVDRNTRITQLEQQRASERFEAAMVGLSAALQSAQPTTQSGYVKSPSGQITTFQSTVSSPALAAQAQQQGLANSAAMTSAADARYAQGMAARTTFLATNTLMPGDTYSSIVPIQAPFAGWKAAEATYKVGVCGDSHEFKASYKSVPSTAP